MNTQTLLNLKALLLTVTKEFDEAVTLCNEGKSSGDNIAPLSDDKWAIKRVIAIIEHRTK